MLELYQGGSSDPKDLPPRFKKMVMGGGGPGAANDLPPLRPSPNSMMLKPKTPSSLPKSAMAKLEGMTPLPTASTPKVSMTMNEPAVIISKPSSGDKKRQEKKNQGPTREEVFSKVSVILQQLVEHGSTNEASTAWREDGWLPAKMVNNALIHLYKSLVKMEDKEHRALVLQLVDQLVTEEAVSQIQCKESLSKIISLQVRDLLGSHYEHVIKCKSIHEPIHNLLLFLEPGDQPRQPGRALHLERQHRQGDPGRACRND